MKTRGEFWTFMITMVIGGLTYSILSFSYMTATFVTAKRVDRMEDDIKMQLRDINHKLDKLILRGR